MNTVVSAAVGGVVGGVAGVLSNLLLHRHTRKKALKDELIKQVTSIQSQASKYWSANGSTPEESVITTIKFDEFRTSLHDYGEQYSTKRKIKGIEHHYTLLWEMVTGGDFATAAHVADIDLVRKIKLQVQVLNRAIRSS